MNLVIVGAGKVGETLVQNFLNEKHDVVVVDKNELKVSEVVNRYDVNGLVGGGLDRDVLLDAGADKADFFIACTSRDEINILCCVIARKLGAKKTIARVRDPEYFSDMETVREQLGVDFFFNPEYRTALEIKEVLKFPSAKEVERFAGGRANMVEFVIQGENPLVNKSLREVFKEYGNLVLVAMVRRGEQIFIPKGDFVVRAGDCLHIIGADSDIAKFTKSLKIFKPRAKTAFIIGGGMIARYLAEALISDGVNVKIIEMDSQRADELAEALPKATVILGDGKDQEILNEESFKNCDACISLTGKDEQNIIISLYAQQKKLGKVITKIDSPSVLSMVNMLGLDTVVSPRTVIANSIVRFVRANQAEVSGGSAINKLYKFHDEVEALEFTVGESFSALGVPIKEMAIKDDVLIGGIVRGEKFILPGGDSKILAGDKVIIVTAVEQITALEQILK